MAAMGLKWEGEEHAYIIDVFPKNWHAVHLFFAMMTQARISDGPNGQTWRGFDYAALPVVMDLVGIPKKHRADTFSRLRIMEAATIQGLNNGNQ